MVTALRPLRHFLAVIAFIGALTGGLMPSGWMPEAHGDGQFSLVICTADGPLTLTLDEHGQPVDADALEEVAKDTRCDFAGLAGPAMLPESPALLAITHPQSLVIKAQSEALARNPVRLPGQRGPPSFPEFLSLSA
ncbi:MAG: hypothetical protein JJU26_12235 [Oceanicaulis sp.]|uniref:DUF2946 family protein n=1 Tax=Glycocaulis sp. TaxID=1969725 RepID=UPI0025C138F2|nr:DUF2946 family protein [Glycocaulis sp.]MCC5982474.1 hypothetical protein [Oceanicaulis sp.]MCH8521176.1 hypothetical protein [Glycocaulis sp.]